jgi:hypothetical protein
VALKIASISDDVDAINRGSCVIGYIRHVGHTFVALIGARFDRAEECGQSQLWDKAATRLLQEAETRISVASNPAIGHDDRNT